MIASAIKGNEISTFIENPVLKVEQNKTFIKFLQVLMVMTKSLFHLLYENKI
jgi:hypothetical protein